MNFRRTAAVLVAVLLVSCTQTTPEPAESPTPSAVSPSSSVTPSTTYPIPMNLSQDLTQGGAKLVVQRMMQVVENRPALKLDISRTEVTLTVLTIDEKPLTLRWRDNKIDKVDSDIQYLKQATFRPTDYPLGNVDELFQTADKMGATGTEKVLQIVEYQSGGIYMTVTTSPETKTVFFERDGSVVRHLGVTSIADLTDGLASVIGGSRATTQVGFDPNLGYWVDLPPNNGVTERRIRAGSVPMYVTRRNESSGLTPFDPTKIDALVLARSITKFTNDKSKGCKVEIDNRYQRETPIARYDCDGKVHYTDLEGTEYKEQELR